MVIPKLDGKVIYGGDYNPEQWPEEVWHEDVKLMQQAGVNLVSLAIFAWARIQPNEETYDLGWLRRVMDLLYAHGVFVCLATATASPPPWLSKKYPDVLAETAEGVRFYPGARQHYSPLSPNYRRATVELVRKLAEELGDHPALAAWHVNNEYACHSWECHSEAATKAFREWLKQRYGTIDELNRAWGTMFWSQLYGEWDEIFTPRKMATFANPTQQLDYKRFMNDSILELYLLEHRALKKLTPEIPVTTNFMGFFKPLDYRQWAREMDFISWDNYPDPGNEAVGRHVHASGNDVTRSLMRDKPFILMEQATSAVNWREVNVPKRPGIMRLWSHATVARGGDGVMFFQWRASRAGAEKFHSGLVQHCGVENSRVFREVSQLGEELKRLAPVAGSLIKAKAAILIDWESWWALELDSHPAKIDYIEWLRFIHRWFYEQNIQVDFADPADDLSDYSLAVAPALYMIDQGTAQNLDNWVSGGGVLLGTYFTGIVDENDHIVLGGYPALLRKAFGMWVEEWRPYYPGTGNTICWRDGGADECEHWAEVIHLEGAASLADFGGDYFAGSPAITRNAYGKGFGFYLGTRPTFEGLGRLLKVVCEQAQVKPVLEAPRGVEATLREGKSKSFLFLMNHNDSEETVALDGFAGRDLISGAAAKGQIVLKPLDVAVLELA